MPEVAGVPRRLPGTYFPPMNTTPSPTETAGRATDEPTAASHPFDPFADIRDEPAASPTGARDELLGKARRGWVPLRKVFVQRPKGEAQRGSVLAALVTACAIALPSAQALPLAKAQVALQQGGELIAQKSREDDSKRPSKSKSQRSSGEEESKGRPARYGSRAAGTSVPLTTRGAYLFSPSFNGVYTPPSGYSSNGYPIYYADEVAATQAECAPLRRRALSSGQRSSWDRYYACVED